MSHVFLALFNSHLLCSRHHLTNAIADAIADSVAVAVADAIADATDTLTNSRTDPWYYINYN